MLKTPLFSWHQTHGGRLVDFAGWSMPVQYESIVAEHLATRQVAGLFDVSHMGRVFVEGPQALSWLEGLLTRRVADLAVGRARYTLVTGVDSTAVKATTAAVILDDALVTRLADADNGTPRLLLVVNASNCPRVIRWLESQLPASGVQLTDRTAATAMIAVQGPLVFAAEGLLRQVCAADTTSMLAALPVYGAAETTIGETPAIVSRTGYTGEDGVELVVDSAVAVSLWERLLTAGGDRGVRPCGLGSRDTLRLEAGMPLYGHELTELTDPFAIGLGRAIELDGRTFPGVAELSARRVAGGRQRVGLQFQEKRAARLGDMILPSGTDRVCGEVTSGSFSPTLGCGIAMAMVEPAAAAVGTELEATVRGSRLPARVVPLPFYRRSREAS
ncbi:MAG: Aminomethyltransferase [Planctomycetota bacterium]